jgi:23S rRNA (uridine2552-2'-O)-methyltransferase
MSFKVRDHYFKKAKRENFYARSVFKLEEIDKKFSLLKKGHLVLDLGYYPGSWIQYTAPRVKKVIGVDIKNVNKSLLSFSNVSLFKKDIFEINGLEEIRSEEKFDCLLSDMAPDTTGIKSLDQARSLALVEKVFEILPVFLKNGGNLVIKVFQSQDASGFLKDNKKNFKELKFFRPKSTRSVSKEFFVIGKGYLG